MTKFTIIVFIIYILYYAINIVYDLFLKKDFSTDKIIEEHTFDHVKTVSVDDVENANVPENHVATDLWENVKSIDSDEEKTDINTLKKVYEIEESIGKHFDMNSKVEEQIVVEENITEEPKKEGGKQDSSSGDLADNDRPGMPLSDMTDRDTLLLRRAKNKYKPRPNKYSLDEYKTLMLEQSSALTVVKEIDGFKVYSITKGSV